MHRRKREQSRLFLLPLLMVLLTTVLTPVFVRSAVTSWSIQSGFKFYGTDAGGPVDFDITSSAQGWTFSDSMVQFQSLKVDSFTYSQLGFNCSSNAEMSILSTKKGVIEYTVTANAGQTSTTHIQFPVAADIKTVKQADSYEYNSATYILKVTKTHSSTATITVEFLNGGSGVDHFTNVRDTWMSMFQFVALMIGMSLMYQVANGDSETVGWQTLIWFAVTTAILMILLQITENIWNPIGITFVIHLLF